MMRKIKLTRANKSILLKALAPYYYQEKALGGKLHTKYAGAVKETGNGETS